MPCPSQSFTGVHSNDWRFDNWSSKVIGQVANFYQPSDLGSLVKVVVEATETGREIRVIGSLWSMEDIAFSPDIVISLASLAGPISEVLNQALTPVWQDRQSLQVQGTDRLVHLQAGIRIDRLNQYLYDLRPRCSMKTLGGANGQTLGGAISTGTHGGDINMPPIHDYVMAIHLVAPSGKQIWVERGSDPVTSQDKLAALLSAECADTQIVRDDILFNAALVSMGRLGVIYSCILRVEGSGVSLAEWTTVQSWANVRSLLRSGLASGTFLTPLLNDLPSPNDLPPPFAALNAYDVATPVGLEIVINTMNPENCWVKRRWGTSSQLPEIAVGLTQDAICALGTDHFLGLVNAAFASFIAVAATGILMGNLGGPIVAAVLIAGQIKFNSDLQAIPNYNIGDILSLFFNTLWDLHVGFVSQGLEELVFSARYAETTTTGKRGPAHIIKTGHTEQSQQTCYRADSVEPAFDAWQFGYLDYLDDVVSDLPKHNQAGYISIRYSATSRALLSMHNFPSPNAVSVEITSLRGLKGNAEWMRFVEGAALPRGGRPHWGQMNSMTNLLCYETHEELAGAMPTMGLPPWLANSILASLAAFPIYGNDLKSWRSALVWLSEGKKTFSSNFTRTRNLEPTVDSIALNPIGSETMLVALSLLLD